MTRTTYFVAMVAALLMALPAELMASSKTGLRWLQLNNRIRVEYDDNVYQTETDELDSLKVILEPELAFSLNGSQTFLGLNYRPQLVWWSDREPDTSVNHNLDATLNHEFTPRLSISVKDIFRIAEESGLVDRGTQFTTDSEFMYNSLNGSVMFKLTPETRMDLAGRYHLLRYDLDERAAIGDYDIYVVGLDVRHQLVPETAIIGEVRSDSTEYETPSRDSTGAQLGVAAEQMFNPNLIGKGRVGLSHKSFEDDGIDDSDTPYVEANLTVLPSPATRVSAGLGYDQAETDVYPFTNQKRFRLFGSVGHDITARVTWDLTASYTLNNLDGKQAITEERIADDGTILVDGDEAIAQLSTRLSYRINRSNSVEIGWQLINLESDVREDYLRNRLNLGWKTEI